MGGYINTGENGCQCLVIFNCNVELEAESPAKTG